MIAGVSLFDSKLLSGGAAGSTAGVSQGAASIAGMSFGDMLSAAASRTMDTLQSAETVSVKALQGDADTREVVDAVMSAEQALQTAISIRDKIVSAYLEVSRMAI
jgi:flagellar hook-basal body complex protein FliE